MCGCEWYQPITRVVLPMVAVITCGRAESRRPTSNSPPKPYLSIHTRPDSRKLNKGNQKKKKEKKDISACAVAAASSSGLTSTRSFFRSHLICGDAPHISAVEPPLPEDCK